MNLIMSYAVIAAVVILPGFWGYVGKARSEPPILGQGPYDLRRNGPQINCQSC